MKRLLLLLALAVPLSAETVEMFHFSDYHSHALPFFTDEGERGGIARAIGYLKRQKDRGALVFNGGDTMNAGSPAWSDKYGCAEWAWLGGVVDAMALGNHDADYGRDAYERCRTSISYPVLSANTPGFRPYALFERNGVRIGVFAVAGRDFTQLVKVPGLTFGDPVAAARETVAKLRGEEKADVVVMIGHEHAEADYELARAVEGIDVIFGSHSHLKRELTQIPGTTTWFISPSQYLTYISRVVLKVEGGRVTDVRGELIPVDASMRPDRRTARRVRRMQRELERDPEYRALFLPIGSLAAPLPTAALAQRTLETMKRATGSDAAVSTVSSFRLPLPAGLLTMEMLRGSLPYDNEIITCSMSGAQLRKILGESGARAGSDSELYVDVPPDIRPDQRYKVATTDYMAFVSYKEQFDCEKTRTGLKARDELRKALAAGD